MVFLNSGNSKLALVIGINYNDSSTAKLNGCINDTYKIIDFLKFKCGYQDDNIVCLTDDTDIKPTKNNILNSIREFVEKAQSGNFKELWFSYSGHGSYISAYAAEETDGQDEALVPLDYKDNGLISDNDIYSQLVEPLPSDCCLFSIVDACHSGTSLDLPFVYRVDGGLQKNNNNTPQANVIKLSGCRDNQTSADAYINNKFQGALTFTFIKTLNDLNFNLTPRQLAKRVKSYLNNNKFNQIPTITLSRDSTLDELIIGSNNNERNINIFMEGDSWCRDESSWNIYSVDENKLIYQENKRFYINNEKVNYPLYLVDGTYILIFHDTYGDGGVKGNIKFLNSGVKIKEFYFNSGSYKSLEFKIDNKNDVEPVNVIKNIDYEVSCDYYGIQESSWNVVDNLNNNIFNNDNKFSTSNEIIKLSGKINSGNYRLKLIDTYGDGGISAKIKIDGVEVLNYQWMNMDWNNTNGYLKFIDFSV